MKVKFIKAEATAGDDIRTCVAKCLSLAEAHRTNVLLNFNNIDIHVDQFSTVDGKIDEYYEFIKNKGKDVSS